MSHAHSPLTVAEDCGLVAAPGELEEPEQAAGERTLLPFGELGHALPSKGASGEGAGVERSVSSATGCSAAGFRRGCPATICPKFLKCHTGRHEETLKKLYVPLFQLQIGVRGELMLLVQGLFRSTWRRKDMAPEPGPDRSGIV